MRRAILLFLMCASVAQSFAGNSFGLGKQANLYTYQFDGQKSLVLEFKEIQEYCLRENVIIKFKFEDGRVLKLTGKKENCVYSRIYDKPVQLSIRDAVVWNTYLVVLPLSKEQIEMFKTSLSKIVINTLPTLYIQEVTNKNFVINLYKSMTELKDEFE